jgi:ankyrin repeat protein
MEPINKAIDAIHRGDQPAFETLLDEHPQLAGARDDKGVSLLMLACYHRQHGVASALARSRALDVFEAAALGETPRLIELCRKRPELVHATSPDGFQPLHLAAFFARTDAARELITLGADINAVADNPSRVRPIHSAVASRNRGIVQLLVEHGAQLDVQQHGGWAPLHAAAMHGDLTLVELFLRHGADPTLRSDDGKDAAELAAANNHADILAALDRYKTAQPN